MARVWYISSGDWLRVYPPPHERLYYVSWVLAHALLLGDAPDLVKPANLTYLYVSCNSTESEELGNTDQ